MGGSRTPAYVAAGDGSRTVNPYNDGSRTVNPYGGVTTYGGPGASGGVSVPYTFLFDSKLNLLQRTPAWNPTATSSSYTNDPFSGAGGRTPAYEPSHTRTPAYNDPSTNNTQPSNPRPYDAPTPGKDFTNAPTPAAQPANGYGNVGSTPAAVGAAPTPKFSGDAPTPFSGLPETPGFGAGDGDDGPRYEEGTPSP